MTVAPQRLTLKLQWLLWWKYYPYFTKKLSPRKSKQLHHPIKATSVSFSLQQCFSLTYSAHQNLPTNFRTYKQHTICYNFVSQLKDGSQKNLYIHSSSIYKRNFNIFPVLKWEHLLTDEWLLQVARVPHMQFYAASSSLESKLGLTTESGHK